MLKAPKVRDLAAYIRTLRKFVNCSDQSLSDGLVLARKTIARHSSRKSRDGVHTYLHKGMKKRKIDEFIPREVIQKKTISGRAVCLPRGSTVGNRSSGLQTILSESFETWTFLAI